MQFFACPPLILLRGVGFVDSCISFLSGFRYLFYGEVGIIVFGGRVFESAVAEYLQYVWKAWRKMRIRLAVQAFLAIIAFNFTVTGKFSLNLSLISLY